MNHTGNESKLAIKRSFGWFVELDKQLKTKSGRNYNPHKLELAVHIYSNMMKRIIFYATTRDIFEDGADSHLIAYVQSLCHRLFAIKRLYLRGSYPYEQFMCFYAGNMLKNKVEESAQNKGFREDALESHEGQNKVHKGLTVMSNRSLKGFKYLLEVAAMRQIGGMELYYYNFEAMAKSQEMYHLLDKDVLVEMAEFRNKLSVELSEETAKLVKILMDIPDDKLFLVPPALKPYTENIDADIQIKMIEKLKQKMLKKQQKQNEKDMNEKLKKIYEEYNEDEIEKQLKIHFDRQLSKQKKQKTQRRSKRQRTNQSRANLLNE